MSETYIFRFRDLGKEDGFTIEQHKSIIDRFGFVWWGWWAKNGEVFPTSDINLTLERGPLDIYLFHSGLSTFYKAKLVETKSSQSGELKHESPDKEKTPEYYKDDKFTGWLKLEEINEVDSEEVIHARSYVRLDSLYPNSTPDPDDQLYDKVIFSPKELVKQDRTIWKSRPKQDGDLEHEALAVHYIPSNFTKTFSQKRSNVILWLSDIHFDNGGGRHNFPFTDNQQHKSLSSRVENLLTQKSTGDKCAALLISGDLTWQSQIEGFQHAQKFISDLKSSLHLSGDDIAICPGNHDVGLVTIDEYKRITNSAPGSPDWERLVEAYYEEQKQNYINFYKDIFKRSPEDNLAQGRKFLLGGHKVVEVAAINSCFLQQVKDTFQGVGFIGEQQLSDVANQMGWKDSKKKNGTVRICMLHHHLTSVNVSEDAYLDFRYSVTLDAERLMQWVVEHEVDYVLHGHMHNNFNIEIKRKKFPMRELSETNPEHNFKILSLGSSGVDSENLVNNDAANYACLIDFSNEKPVFEYYKIDKTNRVSEQPEYKVEG